MQAQYKLTLPALDDSEAYRTFQEQAMNYDKELDARGLNCPLPILRTKKSLAGLQSGQVLKVSSTDPGSVKDMQAFARQTANELLSTAESGDEFIFLLRKH